MKWKAFWQDLWGQGLENFKQKYIVTRSMEIDETKVDFKIMTTSPAFGLSITALLIRDEWDTTMTYVEDAYGDRVASFILTGLPGIGEHHLSYVSSQLG